MSLQVVVVVSLAVPAFALAASPMFPLPVGAEKFDHVVLHPSASEQDMFWLQAVYPSILALDHYAKVFASWRRCSGPEKGWLSYGDQAQGANRFVHIRSQFWISAQNDRAVSVILRYESEGIQHRAKPDNDRQFVAVVQYRVPDAAALLKELNVNCSGA